MTDPDPTYEELKARALDPVYLAGLTDAQFDELIACLNNFIDRDIEHLRVLMARLASQ